MPQPVCHAHGSLAPYGLLHEVAIHFANLGIKQLAVSVALTSALLDFQVIQCKRVSDPPKQIELRFGAVVSIDLFQYKDV
jgi:hypothetical protein